MDVIAVSIGAADTVNEIMHSCEMPLWGVAPFAALEGALIRCGGLKRLPAGAKSVVTALFPYYCECPSGEISRYAIGLDYHTVAGDMLGRAALMLRERFTGCVFEPFCDASPIPEVSAARLAGLGVLGRNGLLIAPRYGSFVFIGEIVTDLELPQCEKPGGNCVSCGRCASLCPAGAVSAQGIERERCVSHLTQKKGALSDEQCRIIRAAGTIWGCDICQNACPMNRDIETTYIAGFKSDIIGKVSREILDDENFEKSNASRAFMWRGKEILNRNYGILHGAPDHTITEDCIKEI